jgi:tripartite-type tricarboxylate transporter receptor subunit TctC
MAARSSPWAWPSLRGHGPCRIFRTLREAGVPNFSVPSWLALFAPRGTPDDRVAGLNAEIAKIAAMPEAQKVLLAAGLKPAPNSPSEMRRIIEADHKRWGQLIQARGLRAE